MSFFISIFAKYINNMARILRRYHSEIYGNYRKAYLLYGLVAGLIISVYVFFLRIIQHPISSPTTYGTDIALMLCMVASSFLYRRKLPNENVSLKEMMMFNLGLGIVAAFVFGLFLIFYGNVLDSDFTVRCHATYVQNFMDSDPDEETKANVLAAYANYTSKHWASIGAFRTSVMAIIESFITALIFRTEKGQVR